MFWVVLGHTFLMSQGIAGYENAVNIVKSPLNPKAAETNWLFMFVLNAQMSVDTFFFLGGFLFSLLTVKELQKSRGRFNPISALILRYFRLTPSLGFVMLVYYFIWPNLATGPFAPRFQDSIYRRCDASWWSELTYVLNFIPFDSDKVCMGWTWYLGDDMIFFIVGIVLLPLYYRSRVIGWATIGLLSVASFAVTGYLILKHHLAPEALDYHYQEYSYYAYSKPYTRIPAYFVGVASAWILLHMEEMGITKQTGWVGPVTSTALWSFAMAFLLFLTYSPATDHGNHRNSWNDSTSFIYLNFGRPAWAACWALVTILCYYGHAPMTNALLAHRFWTPFARLTYGAYLCHPLVIKLAAGNAHQYYTFSTMGLAYRWCGNIVCAYGLSFAVWCLVERPMMTFTSALLQSKKATKAEKKGEKVVPTPEILPKHVKPLAGK
jgi:peptidoglycan/LPS O-acetylase OafA/YrhL